MQVKDFYNVYINSKFGEGKPYDFTITMNGDFAKKDWNRVSLIKAAIPKSYYVVTDDNDMLTLYEDNNVTILSLPKGNYSAIQLGNQTEILLNANTKIGASYKVFLNPPYNVVQTGLFYIYHATQAGTHDIGISFHSSYELYGF